MLALLSLIDAVDREHRVDAERVRSALLAQQLGPSGFADALRAVPAPERDAWLDAVLGIDALHEDGPQLPKGCAPYLPCGVETLLRVIEHAPVRASDVFVDVGAGIGRATTFVHLMTGASAIGLEIQPALVTAGSALIGGLRVSHVAHLHGDAASLAGRIVIGSVFFLYCPFGGERLEQLLSALEPIAHTRIIRLCCVDLILPERPWLRLARQPSTELAIYESTLEIAG